MNYVVIIVLVLSVTISCTPALLRLDPDVGKTPLQMIEGHGYPTETHHVTTEDGYILEIYRIPVRNNSEEKTKRSPVLIVHGLTSSSANFVDMGPDRSLGYLLYDEGFDVWILNCRGTTFSRRHVSIDPYYEKDKFFNYSWHQIGYYDVPNTMDYVLKVTDEEKLLLVGHSQGATAVLVTAITRPEYNNKIGLATLMGPPVVMGHVSPDLHDIAANWRMYEFLNLNEIPGDFGSTLRWFGRTFCVDDSSLQQFCVELIGHIAGATNLDEFDMAKIPVLLTNTPNNAAAKQFLHFAQIINSGKFQYYDYGEEGNTEIYGTSTPPEYDLKKVTAPVAIYYSKNDVFVAIKDAEELISRLPNVAHQFEVANANFTHIDFLFSKNVRSAVYYDLVDFMKKY